MTAVKLFMGDTPIRYKTGSGENIYIEVTRAYNDSVRLRVTGPADGRITAYYVVSVEAGEVVEIYGEVVELAGAQDRGQLCGMPTTSLPPLRPRLRCGNETRGIASGTLSEHDRTING